MEDTPILFKPLGPSLKKDYPILRTVEEFRPLTDKELLFVWYYACKSSPIYGLKEKDRVRDAIENVPDFAKELKADVFESYINRDFPTTITEAIKAMKRFEPEVRSRAKLYTERILSYIDNVTSRDIDEYTEVSDIKAFMDMQINIGKNLPSIVEAAEHGYGFGKNKEVAGKKQISILEEEHN